MKQIKGTLIRIKREDKQTLGRLILFDVLDKIFECCTLELPYLENETNISCIPIGVYELEVYDSPSKGIVYLFRNTIDRNYVEIHVGNRYDQIEGCVLIGSDYFDLNNDGYKDVVDSRSTLNKLLQSTNREKIILTIINQY